MSKSFLAKLVRWIWPGIRDDSRRRRLVEHLQREFSFFWRPEQIVAMALDMRFAATRKTGLAQSEVLMGIIPCGGGTQHLTRLLGAPRALKVILGAQLFTAETAEQYGWIQPFVSSGGTRFVCGWLGARHSSVAMDIITTAKAAIAGAAGPLEAGLAQENALMGSLFARPYASQRVQAQLHAGAGTREGERDFERVLRSVEPAT